jgi:hypothetical protein
MILDKFKRLFKKSHKNKMKPNKLKHLLEDAPRKSGLFQFSIPTYDKLGNEWHHPNWTNIYNVILRYIKNGKCYKEVNNKENEYYVQLLLTDVQKKMRVYFRKPKEAPSQTDPFFIYQIKIRDYKL